MSDLSKADVEAIARRVVELLSGPVGKKQRITMGELCKLWGVSSRHVNRLIEKGDITAICLSPKGVSKSRKLVFDPAEIERFEKERATRALEPQPRFSRRPKKRPVDYIEYV
jgi:hypothetical protein